MLSYPSELERDDGAILPHLEPVSQEFPDISDAPPASPENVSRGAG